MKIKKLIFETKPELIFFSILFFYCIVFVILNSFQVLGINLPTSGFSKNLYRINYDHSYAEFFQYLMLLGTSFLIILIFINDKKYLFFLPLFVLFFIDDYFRIHDNYSLIIFKSFLFFFNELSQLTKIRVKDFFELSWHLITLLFFLFSLIILFIRNKEVNDFIIKYIFGIICLIFFGAFIDIIGVKIVEIINTPKHFLNTLIYFFEELGEMTSCAYLFTIFFGLYLKKLNSFLY